MASLLEQIKRAAADAVDATNPVAVLYGVVTSVNPLEVNVDQRFTLTADFLVLTERLSAYSVDLSHTHTYDDDGVQETTDSALNAPVVIRRGLQTGDRVILLRIQGGQKYVILDRVVDA